MAHPRSDIPELDEDLTLPSGYTKSGAKRKRRGTPPAEINGFVPPVLTEIPLAEAPIAHGMSGNRSATLFDKDRTFDANLHDWVHEGIYLVCYTCPDNNAHGVRIGPDVQLLGSRGNWRLAPNGPLCVHGTVLSTCDQKHPGAKFQKVIVS